MENEKKFDIKELWNKVWTKTKEIAKTVVDFVKNIEWTKEVKPVIAWSVYGGVVALSVIIGLIVLL